MIATGGFYPMVAPSTSTKNTMANTVFEQMRKVKGKITSEGMAFLKCAFAPPDFQSTKVQGVPDNFQGNSLTVKHRFIGTDILSASQDVYYVLAPVPGVAYFKYFTATGVTPPTTSQFDGEAYPDFNNYYGSSAGTNADLVSKFRVISNHFEIIPLVNQMNWSGSIQAFKIPLQMIERLDNTNVNTYAMAGLQSVKGASNAPQYSGPIINGVFTGAYRSSPDFEFQQTTENYRQIPRNVLTPADWGILQNGAGIPGYDNGMEAICIKITGVTDTESIMIKTWQCVECIIDPQTALGQLMTESPCDPVALTIYRQVIKELPVGVSYMDNDRFWQRVLQIIQKISAPLSIIPGPYGAVAGGVNTIASGLEGLLF